MKALSCAVALAAVALTGCYTEPKVTVNTPAAVPATAVVGAPGTTVVTPSGTAVTPAAGTTVVVPSR